jgi:hypothetical protein
MRTRRQLTTLILGTALIAGGCDLAPGEHAPATKDDPLTTLGLDEGDQVPNLVASVRTGTSIVTFSEPMPGAVMVMEKSRGRSVVRPEMKDLRQLWRTLAPGQEPPLALRDALDRMDRMGKSLAGAAPGERDAQVKPPRPSPADRARQVEGMARDLRHNNEQVARFEQQLSRDSASQPIIADGLCPDQDFINEFCSNWMYAANRDETCKLNRRWNENAAVDAIFGPWANSEYAFAAVCNRHGVFDFVVQHQTWWSWATDADIRTNDGDTVGFSLHATGLDWDYRYIFQQVQGDGYHRMHFVHDHWFDPRGLGSHNIPPS